MRHEPLRVRHQVTAISGERHRSDRDGCGSRGEVIDVSQQVERTIEVTPGWDVEVGWIVGRNSDVCAPRDRTERVRERPTRCRGIIRAQPEYLGACQSRRDRYGNDLGHPSLRERFEGQRLEWPAVLGEESGIDQRRAGVRQCNVAEPNSPRDGAEYGRFVGSFERRREVRDSGSAADRSASTITTRAETRRDMTANQIVVANPQGQFASAIKPSPARGVEECTGVAADPIRDEDVQLAGRRVR